LKKLEAEKDFYNEEEYKQLYDKLADRKQVAFKHYEFAANRKKIDNTKTVKEISAETARFNQKIAEYMRAVQTALIDGYELKKKLDSLMITTANNAPSISSEVEALRTDLNHIIKSLNSDTDRLDDSSDEVKDADQQEILNILNQLTRYKTRFISRHLEDLSDVESQIKEIEDLIATYRPNTTAKKARIAAAQTKDMSDELLDVIEFTNF